MTNAIEIAASVVFLWFVLGLAVALVFGRLMRVRESARDHAGINRR